MTSAVQTSAWEPKFDMDRLEIGASKANGKVVYGCFYQKWLFGYKMAKMIVAARIKIAVFHAS